MSGNVIVVIFISLRRMRENDKMKEREKKKPTYELPDITTMAMNVEKNIFSYMVVIEKKNSKCKWCLIKAFYTMHVYTKK